MAIARIGRQVKRSYQSYGFYVKLSATIILGLCFVIVWSVFSSFSVTSQRQTFDDIAEPVSAASRGKLSNFGVHSEKKVPKIEKESGKQRFKSGLGDKDKKIVNGSVPLKPEKKLENVNPGGGRNGGDGNVKLSKKDGENKNQEDEASEVEEEEVTREKDDDDGDEGNDADGDGNANDSVEEDAKFINGEEQDQEASEEDNGGSRKPNRKTFGPIFDPKKKYSWKLCNTRSKHNYIPCIDIEMGKLQSYRHHERSCPRSAVMCLVPLPRDGYGTPVRWPESKVKV